MRRPRACRKRLPLWPLPRRPLTKMYVSSFSRSECHVLALGNRFWHILCILWSSLIVMRGIGAQSHVQRSRGSASCLLIYFVCDTSARVKSNLAFQLVFDLLILFLPKSLELARNQLSPNLSRWEHWFGIPRTLLLFQIVFIGRPCFFLKDISNNKNNSKLSKQLLEACGKDAGKEGLQAEERKAGADLRTW